MSSARFVFDTDYPAVRRVMGPAREELDDAALEVVLQEIFPDADPDDVENFMRTFQALGKQAAPILKKVGPGVIQGAVSGGSVAGPWGALAGALGGGALGLLKGGPAGGAPARAPGSAPPSLRMPMPAPALPVVSAPAQGHPGGGAAIGQLLALLARPETLQALLALTMGAHGRSTVAVGSRRVPVSAFANALSELAADAYDEAAAERPDDAGYWMDINGEARCDVADPSQRTGLLVRDLLEEMDRETLEEEVDADDEFELLETWDFEAQIDPLVAFESALWGDDIDDD